MNPYFDRSTSTAKQVQRAKDTLHRLRNSGVRKQRLAEEDDHRRRPEGHFHIAESYFLNARRLRTFKHVGHTDHGVRLMYYTALEVYLKAFLRFCGLSTRELAGRDLGHRYCCILERAGDFGFDVDEEDKAVLYYLSYSDERERVRYIETGSATWIDLDALDRTCWSVRELVFDRLKAAGLPVRYMELPPACS